VWPSFFDSIREVPRYFAFEQFGVVAEVTRRKRLVTAWFEPGAYPRAASASRMVENLHKSRRKDN
jgi:hypothetical protein